jgi:replicative DNA helicase
VEDQIAEFLANQNIPVARATLDMTVERLIARTTSRRAGVSLPKLNAGFAGENQLAKVTEAGELIGDYPMYITDELHDVNAICTWVRAMKIKHDIQLFTLDYVQQVGVTGRSTQYMNENQTLTQVSRKFKRLALELKIPIILLSQLNRGSDHEDRIPTLSDLRGSGSLEQDANMVILLYHDKKEEDREGKRPQWMDVAKNQDGPTGTLPFWFWANYFRFDEAEVNEEGAWMYGNDGVLE